MALYFSLNEWCSEICPELRLLFESVGAETPSDVIGIWTDQTQLLDELQHHCAAPPDVLIPAAEIHARAKRFAARAVAASSSEILAVRDASITRRPNRVAPYLAAQASTSSQPAAKLLWRHTSQMCNRSP